MYQYHDTLVWWQADSGTGVAVIKNTFVRLHRSGDNTTDVVAIRNSVAGLHQSDDTATGVVRTRNTVAACTDLVTVGLVWQQSGTQLVPYAGLVTLGLMWQWSGALLLATLPWWYCDLFSGDQRHSGWLHWHGDIVLCGQQSGTLAGCTGIQCLQSDSVLGWLVIRDTIEAFGRSQWPIHYGQRPQILNRWLS